MLISHWCAPRHGYSLTFPWTRITEYYHYSITCLIVKEFMENENTDNPEGAVDTKSPLCPI